MYGREPGNKAYVHTDHIYVSLCRRANRGLAGQGRTVQMTPEPRRGWSQAAGSLSKEPDLVSDSESAAGDQRGTKSKAGRQIPHYLELGPSLGSPPGAECLPAYITDPTPHGPHQAHLVPWAPSPDQNSTVVGANPTTPMRLFTLQKANGNTFFVSSHTLITFFSSLRVSATMWLWMV